MLVNNIKIILCIFLATSQMYQTEQVQENTRVLNLARTLKKKLSLKSENSPGLMHLRILHVHALLGLLNYKVLLCIPNMISLIVSKI